MKNLASTLPTPLLTECPNCHATTSMGGLDFEVNEYATIKEDGIFGLTTKDAC
jgi:hypothetical protein